MKYSSFNNTNNPLVSVLIPCYNVEKYVKDAVASIQNQTYKNLEIITINDGSTDKTLQILEKLSSQDKRIIVINQENLKLIKTLNKGLDLCKGKYIARMDADDISLPTRIEKQVKFLEDNPDIGIIGTQIKIIGGHKKWKLKTNSDSVRDILFLEPCFCHPTVMFRREIIIKNNLKYNTDYLHIEDYKFWYDFSKVTKMTNLSEELLAYRVHSHQVSQKYKKEQIENDFKLKREILSDYCLLNKIEINLNCKMTLSNLELFRKTKRENNKYLFMLLYSSVQDNYLNIALSVFKNLDFFRLGIKNTIRILLNKYKKINL